MVGRKREAAELMRLYNGNKAELVAIYGRRRVGKTYLVDETFKDKITFRHAGLSPADENRTGMLKAQLEHFYYSLKLQGMEENKKPGNWLEAFYLLENFLMEKDDGGRQVIFLDELPWLDTPRSGFLTAFEAFWNTWGCHRENLMVIVCGSANSWILDKLINNHGGLYNRVTYELKLLPFSLGECEEYFKANDILLSTYDITESYMILGGIPYYLGYFQKDMSLAQNIDFLFFRKAGKLADEYNRLFASIFGNPEAVKKIVGFLSTKNIGFTRRDIVKNTGISEGGTLGDYLNSLIAGDFIAKYIPFGKGREEYYRLTDPFCIFYLHFIGGSNVNDDRYWEHSLTSQKVVSWLGIAFENVCLNHILQIKRALGIEAVDSTCSSWNGIGVESDGVQIDMVISRADNIVNLCEMKFYSDEFTVDKAYYREMLRKRDVLTQQLPKKSSVRTTLITTFGLKHNEYSSVFDNVITLEDLFCLR